MRGGQVTIFVILGLVLFLTVGIIYVVLSVDKQEQDLVDAAQGTTDTAILSTYLADCLDTVVEEQLTRLGRQGGVLQFDGLPNGRLNSQQLLYGITRNNDEEGTGAMGPYEYAVPRYPDDGFEAERSDTNPLTGQQFASFQDGFFGDVFFPAVCSKDGPNRPSTTYRCVYYEGNPPGTPGPNTQDALAERVLTGVRGCADVTAFERATGKAVERLDDPRVNVTYTSNNVLVTLTYPLLLVGETTTRLETFRRDYKVRYLPIAQYAIDLAREESRNITFDPAVDYADISSWRSGITVTSSHVIPTETSTEITAENATLVTITDAQSALQGQSYSFMFLVEHRIPALSQLSVDEAFDLQDDDALDSGKLPAFDPDGGQLSYSWEYDSLGNIAKVTVTDEDGDQDWQDF